MKVRVRQIKPPYSDVPTESLQAILRNHAHSKLHMHISTKQLYDIMGVVADRQDAAGYPLRPTEEALGEFHRYYMPRKATRQLYVDYLGGYDHGLVELSDVLPASLYVPNTKKK